MYVFHKILNAAYCALFYKVYSQVTSNSIHQMVLENIFHTLSEYRMSKNQTHQFSLNKSYNFLNLLKKIFCGNECTENFM